MTAAASFLPADGPRRVGRYELFAEIATGGMATVHLGRVIGAGRFARTVAIKRLHTQYARNPAFAEMFLGEAEVVARVSHPNVVPTLDLIEQDGDLFIVMEFVEGVTLKHLQTTAHELGERVPWNVALTVMDGVLRGLHAAHEAKNEQGEGLELVHRDVSPDNILVGTDGFARAFDFGIAKALGQSHTTSEGHVKGKVAYMTPEQLLGKPITRRADVFAASNVLWESLTGHALFARPDVGRSMHRLLHVEVPPPSALAPHLPAGLDAIVLRGLDRDPAARWATTLEMAEALTELGGLASHGEVGEWVRDLARERLTELAGAVRAMESTAPLKGVAGAVAGPAASNAALDDAAAAGTPLALSAAGSITQTRRRKIPLATAWIAVAGLLGALLIWQTSTRSSSSAAAGTTAAPGETATETSAAATTAEPSLLAEGTSSAGSGTGGATPAPVAAAAPDAGGTTAKVVAAPTTAGTARGTKTGRTPAVVHTATPQQKKGSSLYTID